MNPGKVIGLIAVAPLFIAILAITWMVVRLAYRELSGSSEHEEILAWLRGNPGWHYASDIAKGCFVSRSSIYVHLGRLEERGKIRRDYEQTDRPGMPRTMYRAVENDEPPYPNPTRPLGWPANYNGPAPRDIPRPTPPPPPPSKR